MALEKALILFTSAHSTANSDNVLKTKVLLNVFDISKFHNRTLSKNTESDAKLDLRVYIVLPNTSNPTQALAS